MWWDIRLLCNYNVGLGEESPVQPSWWFASSPFFLFFLFFYTFYFGAFDMLVLLQKNHSAEPAINRFANRVFDREMKKATVALIAPRLWAQPHYWSGPGAVSPFPTLGQHKSSYISTFLQSNVTNNYQSRGSDTERRGRCLVLMQASGWSLLAKELHSQPVTVTNLAWHQADIQYPSTLSADWLEVIDLEQWGHLLNALKPPFCARIAKLGQRSSLSVRQ